MGGHYAKIIKRAKKHSRTAISDNSTEVADALGEVANILKDF